jgi:hypothetical protein
MNAEGLSNSVSCRLTREWTQFQPSNMPAHEDTRDLLFAHLFETRPSFQGRLWARGAGLIKQDLPG